MYINCRTSKCNSKNSTLESKKPSPCKNTLFTSNKKCLKPLLGLYKKLVEYSHYFIMLYNAYLCIGGPYKSSIKQQSLSDEPKSSNKSFFGQRVMSAKILRFKQLQNQLADAHYHLNVGIQDTAISTKYWACLCNRSDFVGTCE